MLLLLHLYVVYMENTKKIFILFLIESFIITIFKALNSIFLNLQCVKYDLYFDETQLNE